MQYDKTMASAFPKADRLSGDSEEIAASIETLLNPHPPADAIFGLLIVLANAADGDVKQTKDWCRTLLKGVMFDSKHQQGERP